MARKHAAYNWAQAIFDVASNPNDSLTSLVASAGLDAKAGDLRDIDLRGLDLRRQDLRGWDLRFAKLKGAELEGTDLRDAKLDVVELVRANDWQKATLDKYTEGEARKQALIDFLMRKFKPSSTSKAVSIGHIIENLVTYVHSMDIHLIRDILWEFGTIIRGMDPMPPVIRPLHAAMPKGMNFNDTKDIDAFITNLKAMLLEKRDPSTREKIGRRTFKIYWNKESQERKKRKEKG